MPENTELNDLSPEPGLFNILTHLALYLDNSYKEEATLRQHTAPLFNKLDTAFAGGSSASAYQEFRDGFETLVSSKRRNPKARSLGAGLDALQRRAASIVDRGKIADMDAERSQRMRERFASDAERERKIVEDLNAIRARG
jgi:hypothetical protein